MVTLFGGAFLTGTGQLIAWYGPLMPLAMPIRLA